LKYWCISKNIIKYSVNRVFFLSFIIEHFKFKSKWKFGRVPLAISLCTHIYIVIKLKKNYLNDIIDIFDIFTDIATLKLKL
jgi:hypothetical protein